MLHTSQYIPLKQGLRQSYNPLGYPFGRSQYIPLKQGFFSIQNYELRIKNEKRNGVASVDSWNSGRPDVHCTLYIAQAVCSTKTRIFFNSEL